MKYLLLLLLIPVQSFSQCKLIKDKDPYTREARVSTGFVSLQGASVSLDANKREIDMLFNIEGENKCFDNNSSAMVYFEGSKVKMSMRNSGTMNCEGLFHFNFKNSTSVNYQLKKLTTQKISRIEFIGPNQKVITVFLTGEMQDKLFEASGCLMEEASNLLQQ